MQQNHKVTLMYIKNSAGTPWLYNAEDINDDIRDLERISHKF